MYRGKYVRFCGKRPLLVASLVLLLTVSVIGTVAFLVDETDPVVNQFLPTGVPVSVQEDITSEPGVKKDVTIQNDGDIDAYIRAAVVITWANNNGEIYGKQPVEDVDYEITYPANTGWVKGADNFYYYTQPVHWEDIEPGAENNTAYDETGCLLTDCKPLDTADVPVGYHLSVEILAQSIQAQGGDDHGTAVQQAWGVTITENSVTPYSPGN